MKKLSFLVISFVLLFSARTALSQGVAISEGTSQPDPSAILDIQSSEKGLLIPRLSTQQRLDIFQPADGLMVFDAMEHKLYVYHAHSDLWSPLALATESPWVYDSLSNSVILAGNDSTRVGIGTATPAADLDVQGDIHSSYNIIAGSYGSINYKILANGETVPGLERNPAEGWTGFGPYAPDSIVVIREIEGHDSVACVYPNQNPPGGPGEMFFVISKPFSFDALDMEIWAYIESSSILLGLCTVPTGEGEPVWIAALTPQFDDDPYKSKVLIARYDSISGSDTIRNSASVGSAPHHCWNHYRIAWQKGDYFRAWLNGTQIADLPGSDVTPEMLLIGGFDTFYFDAPGLSSEGYQTNTNLGRNKSVAKVGFFDMIFAKNLPVVSGDYLPISGGTLTGNLRIRSTGNYDSGSRIRLTSVDSTNTERGSMELYSSTYYYNSEPQNYQGIYSEGDLNFSSNRRMYFNASGEYLGINSNGNMDLSSTNGGMSLNSNGSMNLNSFNGEISLQSNNRISLGGYNGRIDLYSSGRIYMNSYNDDIEIDAYNIRLLPFYNGLVVKRDVPNGRANVGIGTYFPHSRLTVAGTITPEADAAYDLGTAQYRWYSIYTVNGVIQTSDVRLKKNITELRKGLDYVMKLNPVVYEWKDKDGPKHFGLIAQEVDQDIPKNEYSVVSEGNDPEHRLGINYAELVPVLIRSVQELKEENDRLRLELEKIQAQMAGKK